MIVIADTNIFYSALISPEGETARILNEKDRIQFFIPDYLIEEMNEHLPNIQEYLKKKNLRKTKRQLLSEFKKILHGIKVVPIQEIKEIYVSRSKKIVQDIDLDDYPFIALHLQIKHKIWSSDKVLIDGLTAKGYGHFFISTQELKAKLYKNNKK